MTYVIRNVEHYVDQNRGPQKEHTEIMVGVDKVGVPEYDSNETFFDSR